MPFTPSHAVVALPFLRTPIAPAAVAVGAMAPDLPLFVRGFGLDYERTHDLAWLPLTLLIALVLLLAWRMLLRPAVRELSPRILAVRLPASWDAGALAGLRETFAVRGAGAPSATGALLTAVGLALGVATHILWDAFTHEDRWGTRLLPMLDAPWGPWPAYRWLQHGSSAAGLAILGVWALLWLRARVPAAKEVRRVLPRAVRAAWLASLPVVLVVGAVVGTIAFGYADADAQVTLVVYRALAPAAAAWGSATLVLAVVVQVLRRRGARGVARD